MIALASSSSADSMDAVAMRLEEIVADVAALLAEVGPIVLNLKFK